MRLIDLNPAWVGYGGEGVTHDGQPVPRRERVGLWFDCPCGNGEKVALMFRNPPDGGPAMQGNTWERTGNTFETLTLKPSIQRSDPNGCRWHGFLTDGAFKSV